MILWNMMQNGAFKFRRLSTSSIFVMSCLKDAKVYATETIKKLKSCLEMADLAWTEEKANAIVFMNRKKIIIIKLKVNRLIIAWKSVIKYLRS